MTAAFTRSVTLLALCLATLTVACGDSPTSPSQSSLIQGTVNLTVGQLAVVTFSVTRAGIVNTRADWNSASNDVDTVLMRGRCTALQVLNETGGCTQASAAVATDGSLNKPSLLAPSLQPGDYTFVIANWGPVQETASYRVEGGVSGGSPAATSPSQTQKTETFPFTLNGTTRNTVTVGPVNAGPGPLSVTIDYAGAYNIQACVGTAAGCRPTGGTPGFTGTFNIPADFPAGSIRADVYFNPNRAIVQPPGNPSGTITFRFYAP
jgi:hypothetical protein